MNIYIYRRKGQKCKIACMLEKFTRNLKKKVKIKFEILSSDIIIANFDLI